MCNISTLITEEYHIFNVECYTTEKCVRYFPESVMLYEWKIICTMSKIT